MWTSVTSGVFLVAALLHNVHAQMEENLKAGFGHSCVSNSSCLAGLTCNGPSPDRYCVCGDNPATLTETCARNFVVCRKNVSSVHCKVFGTDDVVLRYISVLGVMGNNYSGDVSESNRVTSVTRFSPIGNSSEDRFNHLTGVTGYTPSSHATGVTGHSSLENGFGFSSPCGNNSECFYRLQEQAMDGLFLVQVALSYNLKQSTGDLLMNLSLFDINATINVSNVSVTSVSAEIAVDYQDTERQAAFIVVQSSDSDFDCTVFVFDESCYSQKDFAACTRQPTVLTTSSTITPTGGHTTGPHPDQATLSSRAPMTRISTPNAGTHFEPVSNNAWHPSNTSQEASSSLSSPSSSSIATSGQSPATAETTHRSLLGPRTPNDTSVTQTTLSNYNSSNNRSRRNVQASGGTANATEASVQRGPPRKLTVGNLWSSTRYRFTLSPWICVHPSGDRAVQDFPAVLDLNTSDAKLTVVEAQWVKEKVGEVKVTWHIDGALPAVTYYVYVTNVRPDHGCHLHQESEIINPQLLCSLPSASVHNSCTGNFSRNSVWEYNVTVEATSDRGNFSSQPLLFRWTEPSMVYSLSHSLPTVGPVWCGTTQLTNVHKACIKWSDFCSRERRMGFYWYIVSVAGGKQKTDSQCEESGHDDFCLLNYSAVVDVTPGSNVSVSVHAGTRDGQTGPVTSVDFTVPLPDLEPLAVHVRLAETSSPNRTLRIVLNSTEFLHRTAQGLDFDHYFFVVVGSKEIMTDTSSIPLSHQTYPSWFNRKNGSQIEYRVQLKLPNRSGPATLMFGNENCNDLDNSIFCNGPLDPGYYYTVGALLCIEQRCRLVYLVHNAYIFTQDPEIPETTPVWGKVLMGLGIIIAFALLVLIIYRCSTSSRKRYLFGSSETNGTVLNTLSRDVPSKLPIKLADLEEILTKKLSDDGLLLRQEYDDLKVLCRDEVSHITCDLEVNRRKNRYADIYTYDHSRVKLSPDVDESDYINANFVPGYSQDYIATQGPLPYTITDFWKMVWEYQVPVIVMLTLPKELGKVKCEQYWPSAENESKQYGDVTVTSISVSNMNDRNISIFKLEHSGEPGKELMVSHFLYLKWPDMTADVPPESMVDFIAEVRQHVKPKSSRPVVVHCSAGVGRTGTYIGIDYIMKFLEEQPIIAELDIYGFVVRMRQARVSMVQTEDQYILLHRYALHLIRARRERDEVRNGNSVPCPASPSTASTPSVTTLSTASACSQPTVENIPETTQTNQKPTDDVTLDLNKEDSLNVNQATPGAQEKPTDDVTIDLDKEEPLSGAQTTSGAQQKVSDDVTLDLDKEEPLSGAQTTSGTQQNGTDDDPVKDGPPNLTPGDPEKETPSRDQYELVDEADSYNTTAVSASSSTEPLFVP